MIALFKMLNTNRHICDFSHSSAVVSGQNAPASVEDGSFVMSLSDFCFRLFVCVIPNPANARTAFLVKNISGLIDVAEVGYSVVRSVVIDVIDDFRLFVASKEPSNPVSQINVRSKHKDNISLTVYCSGNISDFNSVSFGAGLGNPSKQSRFRIVVKEIADRFWNNAYSHFESPLNLVRGLAVGAVSTPILSRGAAQ